MYTITGCLKCTPWCLIFVQNYLTYCYCKSLKNLHFTGKCHIMHSTSNGNRSTQIFRLPMWYICRQILCSVFLRWINLLVRILLWLCGYFRYIYIYILHNRLEPEHLKEHFIYILHIHMIRQWRYQTFLHFFFLKKSHYDA